MAFQSLPSCETTVTLLRAFTLGAEDACVSISVWSVATVIIPFIVAVVVLQYLARRALGKTGGANKKPLDESENVYGAGPIRSTGAWRDKDGVR